MKRKKKPDSVDFLREVYDLYVDIMDHPSRLGYILLLKKVKGDTGRLPINIRLFDYFRKKDREIRKIGYQMLKKIGLDKLPDGIKE